MAGSLTNFIRTPIFGSGTKTGYTGTAGSTTVPANSQSVYIICSTAAYVRIGGTALTTDFPVAANVPVTLPIAQQLITGAPITVSAIQDAAGGNLYCIGLSD